MESTKTKVPEILDDDRPIKGIFWDGEENPHYIVGSSGVTKIIAYGEPGQHCYVPWIAVYRADELVTRVPAGQVQITYA